MTQNDPRGRQGPSPDDELTIASNETVGDASRTLSDASARSPNGPQHGLGSGHVAEYRLIDVIGVGGMGIVYRAEDARLRRTVALKVMKPEVAANAMARKRFLREAESAARIDHENIVTIYQVGEHDGVPFIAMGYLVGESLRQKLKREGRIEPRIVANIGRQVATGLAAAHQLGLIHRDIKPENLWLEAETGRVKILDFGLARTQESDMRLTQSGMVLGTPKYMSPEQATAKTVDHRSDLFSLGSVLYHLLSGHEPFGGKDSASTLINVTQAEFAPVEKVCPHLNPALGRIINRLLAKHPAKRPQTAREVAMTLAEIEQQLEAEYQENARRQSLTETAELPATASSSPASAPIPINVSTATGKPPLLSLVLLGLGILLVGLLLLAFLSAN
ncbi:Serine/threonine-protein kinase PrkC [Stieleria neptunia]|uniref:non-specific serine/threonine protein kinase n=1 Tax=Stieleria neptunia TaxID=2527979 RepID=A0A518I1S6_9BACT|nr:serine/threonine-protein kinase [Stieleria neptunia]QDV47072.1 Serine/threonine-protein kinase PrkC [Stieleria neptunia]